MTEKTYVETLSDYIAQQIKPGTKLVIETSNECGHLDLKTGEWITDHYSEERYEAPAGNVG